MKGGTWALIQATVGRTLLRWVWVGGWVGGWLGREREKGMSFGGGGGGVLLPVP